MDFITNDFLALNSDLIKERRIKYQLTQEQLSERTGISRSQIQRIESSNTSNINYKAIYRLCETLHLDFGDVVVDLTKEEILND